MKNKKMNLIVGGALALSLGSAVAGGDMHNKSSMNSEGIERSDSMTSPNAIGTEGTSANRMENDTNRTVTSDSTTNRTSTNSERSDIERVQTTLMDNGYEIGSVDGVMGPRTQSAIKEYQKDNDLEQTGSLDDATRDRMQLNGNSANSEEIFAE